jgi:hypothetical protein
MKSWEHDVMYSDINLPVLIGYVIKEDCNEGLECEIWNIVLIHFSGD